MPSSAWRAPSRMTKASGRSSARACIVRGGPVRQGWDCQWLRERAFYVRGDSRILRPICSWRSNCFEDRAILMERSGNYLFYLATPPQMFSPIVQQLGEAGLSSEREREVAAGDRREAVRDRSEIGAQRSTEGCCKSFWASIRSTASTTISARRRSRTSWCSASPTACSSRLWNRNHIDHVQITVAETVGVETRGKFYDATGALRDMVPNHLFQLLDADGDGAADLLRCRCGAQREGQGAGRRAPIRRRRCAAQCGARPIRCRHGRRTSRSSAYRDDAQCGAGLNDRNLCRAEADDRQLAVGRRAVLSADRQEPRPGGAPRS